jgi:hypothetical protein
MSKGQICNPAETITRKRWQKASVRIVTVVLAALVICSTLADRERVL